MRHPVRAILATFLVSGLGHEYIFSVSSGRLQGYQTAFFLIHGFAVVATLRARPKGRWRLPWRIGTFGFLLVTTVLFGLSVNEIVPVYDDRGRREERQERQGRQVNQFKGIPRRSLRPWRPLRFLDQPSRCRSFANRFSTRWRSPLCPGSNV